MREYIATGRAEKKTGVEKAAISRIESGKASPTLTTLEALVEGVGCSLVAKIV